MTLTIVNLSAWHRGFVDLSTGERIVVDGGESTAREVAAGVEVVKTSPYVEAVVLEPVDLQEV